MGTGGFAVPTFRKLLESGRDVPLLVTMPIRTRKSDRLPLPEIRQVAAKHSVPIFDPDDVNQSGAETLREVGADILFICDYGKILSPEIIGIFPMGGINLHGSILPKYRGAAPINRAILAGETTLGVSVIHITPTVDAGPVIAVDSYEPDPNDTAPVIEKRLAEMGAELLLTALSDIEKGTAQSVPQNDLLACKAPKIRKEEGHIDWNRPVRQIRNQYRGLQPWPKTFSDWIRTDGKPPIRLILGQLEIAGTNTDTFAPGGTVVKADHTEILVQAGDGLIRVGRIQPSGKKAMSPGPFLSGYRMKAGDVLR